MMQTAPRQSRLSTKRLLTLIWCNLRIGFHLIIPTGLNPGYEALQSAAGLVSLLVNEFIWRLKTHLQVCFCPDCLFKMSNNEDMAYELGDVAAIFNIMCVFIVNQVMWSNNWYISIFLNDIYSQPLLQFFCLQTDKCLCISTPLQRHQPAAQWYSPYILYYHSVLFFWRLILFYFNLHLTPDPVKDFPVLLCALYARE